MNADKFNVVNKLYQSLRAYIVAADIQRIGVVAAVQMALFQTEILNVVEDKP